MIKDACKSASFLLVAAGLCGLLSGCALQQTATSTTEIANAGLSGKIHGGQPPVAGAHVYLLAANTTGYGAQSVSMLTSGIAGTDSIGGYVLTDNNGSFSLSFSGTCAANTQLYLLATQGNPGLPAGQTNPNLSLMAVVGACPAAGSNQSIVINEVTTVAAAYALAGYMTDLDHLSSSGTTQALAGLSIAAANASNLASVATGTALSTTPAGNGTVPQAEIDSLANILAGCVNSSGSGSNGCNTLFANATNGSTQPSDTVTAALNIAHNPGANVGTLFGLQSTYPNFQPTLTTAPNDWTVALSFTGGGIYYPQSIAIDGSNNVWLANGGSVSKLNGTTGAAISPSNGYTGNGLTYPFTIAIDPSGNAWVENESVTNYSGGETTATSISVFTPAGGAASFSPITAGGLNTYNDGILVFPSYRNIAFDANGNAWTPNNGAASITELNGTTGAPLSGANGYAITGALPTGVAVDGAGHVWTADSDRSQLYELSVSTGSTLFTSTANQGGLNQPRSLAIDAANNVWLPNFAAPNYLFGSGAGQTVSEFPGSPTATSGQAFSGGGVYEPLGSAIDGSGNLWVSNEYGVSSTGTLTELSNTGAAISPATGYISSAMYAPLDVAIDSAGNVWVPNTVANPTTNGTNVLEFVGAASPVITPMSVAVKLGKVGVRP